MACQPQPEDTAGDPKTFPTLLLKSPSRRVNRLNNTRERHMIHPSAPLRALFLLAVWLFSQPSAAEPPSAAPEGRPLFDPRRDRMIGGTITGLAFSRDGRRLAAADIAPRSRCWTPPRARSP